MAAHPESTSSADGIGAVGKLVVPAKFGRNHGSGVAANLDAAERLLGHACEELGLPDLGDVELLDVGCGVRFTETILDRHLPLKRYVGLDVFGEMIEFLQENVTDPRFNYAHLDVRNELYHPDGPPFTGLEPLPIDGQTFDVIWLFSVFTHLAPADYVTMLRFVRRFARPGTRLLYTVFIDEHTAGGHGIRDQLDRMVTTPEFHAWADANPDLIEKRMAAVPAPGEVPDFSDLDPERPLMLACYSRKHALELIEGTGWAVERLADPVPFAQHQMICRPV